jgi:hypothetical protein
VLFALFPLTDDSLSAEKKNKNQTKYPRFAVEDFETDGFSLGARQKRVQYFVLASILTMGERKSAFSKQVRMALVTLRKGETVEKQTMYRPARCFVFVCGSHLFYWFAYLFPSFLLLADNPLEPAFFDRQRPCRYQRRI